MSHLHSSPSFEKRDLRKLPFALLHKGVSARLPVYVDKEEMVGRTQQPNDFLQLVKIGMSSDKKCVIQHCGKNIFYKNAFNTADV